jgi:hypothetical protein
MGQFCGMSDALSSIEFPRPQGALQISALAMTVWDCKSYIVI